MKSQCCSMDSLAKLLDHQLETVVEAEVIGHLSNCTNCRKRLESLTAEPDFWQDVELQLRRPGDGAASDMDLNCSNRNIEPNIVKLDSDHPPARRSTQAATQPGLATELQQELAASADPTTHDFKTVDHEATINFVTQWLAPTDDPTSLGKLGAYEIVGIIGVGGMGIVLKGFDASLHRSVAVKVLATHLTSSGAARQRFAREAQAAASVVHENVLAIHAIDQWQGVPYFVMPLIRGESLEKRLKRCGALEVLEILRIARQIASGLDAAHQQGMVHRDIKPANILMEHGSERLKIADFGLARAGDDASLTRSGHIVGTPLYMSPEQARGERIDTRSDIFSLGSLLYALSTGHAPFRAETPYGVIRRLCEEEPRSIQEYNPNIPFWLSGIIESMMSKRAEERTNSAGELAELFTAGLVFVQQPIEADLPKELLPFVKVALPASKVVGWTAMAKVGLLASMLGCFFLGWFMIQAAKRNVSEPGLGFEGRPAAVDSSSSIAALDDSQELMSESRIERALSNDSLSGTEADAQLVKQPPSRGPLSYRFALGEELQYQCKIELTAEPQHMVIDGLVVLHTVEVGEQFAEFDYQIKWDHTLRSSGNSQEQLVTGAVNKASVLSTHPLRDPPFFDSRVGPVFQMPHLPSPFFPSHWPSPFEFEQAELQACELTGRAKVGVDGRLLGCSHRTEMPGQLGRVLEWIFPVVAAPGDDRSWRTSTVCAITLPTGSSLSDWRQRQRVQCQRNAEFELQFDQDQAASIVPVDFVLVDTPVENPADLDSAKQTILGHLKFDNSVGKLAELHAFRNSLPPIDANASTIQLRPAKLEIRRIESSAQQ